MCCTELLGMLAPSPIVGQASRATHTEISPCAACSGGQASAYSGCHARYHHIASITDCGLGESQHDAASRVWLCTNRADLNYWPGNTWGFNATSNLSATLNVTAHCGNTFVATSGTTMACVFLCGYQVPQSGTYYFLFSAFIDEGPGGTIFIGTQAATPLLSTGNMPGSLSPAPFTLAGPAYVEAGTIVYVFLGSNVRSVWPHSS